MVVLKRWSIEAADGTVAYWHREFSPSEMLSHQVEPKPVAIMPWVEYEAMRARIAELEDAKAAAWDNGYLEGREYGHRDG